LKTVKKNRPLWYLENCQSRRGILFISENVEVNRVYFYTKRVPRVYHIPDTPCTPHTTHTEHHTFTVDTVEVYFLLSVNLGESTRTVISSQKSGSKHTRFTFQKWYSLGVAYFSTIRTGLRAVFHRKIKYEKYDNTKQNLVFFRFLRVSTKKYFERLVFRIFHEKEISSSYSRIFRLRWKATLRNQESKSKFSSKALEFL
jgi:hypothetical protein